ncbi:unnamed protein product [Rhodiola kirilowii]
MNRDVHMDAPIDENGADLEEIEDNEFNCCVCLELMYKPVVLGNTVKFLISSHKHN